MNEDNNTTYKLTESERRHISEVQAQLNSMQSEIVTLEGQIRLREREMSFMRRHLSIYLGQMATEHGLPLGSALNADMTVLMARGEGVNNGVAS